MKEVLIRLIVFAHVEVVVCDIIIAAREADAVVEADTRVKGFFIFLQC